MLEPSYKEAFSHAWNLVWKHKILIIFGLLAVLVGQFGISNFVGQLWALIQDGNTAHIFAWPDTWPVLSLEQGDLIWIGWLGLIVVALVILIVVAAVCAQGALIAASIDWFRKKTTPSWRVAWKKGVRHFWRLLAVDVAQKILLSGLAVTTYALISAFNFSNVGNFFFLIIVLSTGLVLGFAVSSICIYTAGYILEEEDSLMTSLVLACNLFKRHILVSLEISILLLLLNIVLIAAIFWLSTIVLIPSFFLWLVGGFTGLRGLFTLGLILAAFLFVIALAIMGGLFNAYTTATWMYLFMKMHKHGLDSRLVHYTQKILQKNS